MKGCRSCKNWVAIEEYLDRDDPAVVNAKVQLGACRRYAPGPHANERPAGGTPPRIETATNIHTVGDRTARRHQG